MKTHPFGEEWSDSNTLFEMLANFARFTFLQSAWDKSCVRNDSCDLDFADNQSRALGSLLPKLMNDIDGAIRVITLNVT
jgi:hypothetical protein